MKVDIIIDTICPWCYVGNLRFNRALLLSPQTEVELCWRAFLLDSDLPEGGMERARYAHQKFGSVERARQADDEITALADEEGVDLNFNKIERIPNSLDSHRLIRYAADPELQRDVITALFEAYFLRGRDIGNLSTLADIAQEAGLDRGAALAFLESDQDRATILAEDALARRAGFNAVPCFFVNRKYAISGAQAPEVIAKVFELASRDETAGTGP